MQRGATDIPQSFRGIRMSIQRKVLSLMAAALLWMAAAAAQAATYYVATTGSDSTGDGSAAKPLKSIGAGLARMAGGDTLIVRAGVYEDKTNFINPRIHRIPNGASGSYTTIMAETPYSVRIRNSVQLGYYDNLVLLEG